MITVIVPIYQVEKYIERCACSLLGQTLRDVEYIFVDDCSPDKSLDVLKRVVDKYPWRKDRIKILRHDSNKGLPAARNTGLGAASGDYIFHCDSDDWADETMLEVLYNRAKMTDADIVWCDWFLSFRKNERYMQQPSYQTGDDALKGLLSGAMKYNVWNKLIKKELYLTNHISFPQGHGMAEDMTIIRLFACARRIVYMPGAYYHYRRTNENAYTHTFSRKHLEDILYNTAETISYIRKEKGDKFDKEIEWFKLSVKFPLLIGGTYSMYKLWRAWYSESNSFILSNKNISLRSRLLQYAAWKRLYGVVWLYTKIVHRFIYGIIYR